MSEENPYRAFARPDPSSLVAVRNYGRAIYATITTDTISSVEAPVIGDSLRETIDEAHPDLRHLVIELDRVTLLNSMALGVIVSTHATALNRGARVILAGVTDPVLEILAATKLTKLLDVCRTPGQLEKALGD